MAGRRSFALLVAALLALVVALRSPENLTTPQFYGEDGSLFFQESYNGGFLAALARPTAGYLNTLPRLMADAALLAPLGRAPLVVAVLALLVQMLPVFYLLSKRAAAILPSFSGRAVAALLYVILPNSDEVYITGTNAQWHLMLVGAMILLLPPPGGRLGRAAETALVLIFAFTGPGSLLLLPVALYLLWRRLVPGGEPAGGASLAALATIIAGAVTQAMYLLTSPRVAGATAGGLDSLGARGVAAIVSTHAFYNTFLGEQRVSRMYETFGPAAHLLGLVLLALIAASAVRHRLRPLLLLGYLALATILLSLFFPSNELAAWRSPWFGPRYYFHATLFLVYAVADLLRRTGVWLVFGIALAVPLATLAIPGDLLLPPWPDTHYRDQIAQFETLPAGARFFIPTLPGNWGMTLTRKPGAQPAASPLDRLPALAEEAGATLDPLWVSDTGERIRISGHATDPRASSAAGAVFVVVDGKGFPAVYGQARPVLIAGRAEPIDTFFQREIPVEEVGRGAHRVEIVVLTHDRSAMYRPAAPATFTLP